MEQPKTNLLFSSLTTLQIGGPMSYFVEAQSPDEFTQAARFAKDKQCPILVIGSGSNLLVSDEGFNGMVVKNSIQLIEQVDEWCVAGGGTVLQDFIDWANSQGFGGFEKMAGIPGTIGGAVYGNAGAYGQTISDNIEWVDVFDLKTFKVKRIEPQECDFSYRTSRFKKTKEVILRVGFTVLADDPEVLVKTSLQIIEARGKKYPSDIKCPGSFFKNIEAQTLSPEVLKNIPNNKIIYGKIPAGWLLEAVDAKGNKLDGIEIANWHGNLFINTGDGKAKDFIALAKKYQELVKVKFGINLEPEVQLVGFKENPFL